MRGVGANVTRFALGDAVIADAGVARSGGMAQYATVPEDNVTKKPKNLSFIEAAAFPHAGLIAYQTLVKDLKIERVDAAAPTKRLLVIGGHSDVGSIAVQVAKYFGANVTATVAAGAEEWARRLGCVVVLFAVWGIGLILRSRRVDDVVTTSSWWSHWAQPTFDAIFDTLGTEDGFDKAKPLLLPSGVYATVLPDQLRSETQAMISSWFKTGAVTAGRKILGVQGPKCAGSAAGVGVVLTVRVCVSQVSQCVGQPQRGGSGQAARLRGEWRLQDCGQSLFLAGQGR